MLKLFAQRLRTLARATEALRVWAVTSLRWFSPAYRRPRTPPQQRTSHRGAASPFSGDDLSWQVGTSVGVAFRVNPAGNWGELIDGADTRLYRAKNARRGRLTVEPGSPAHPLSLQASGLLRTRASWWCRPACTAAGFRAWRAWPVSAFHGGYRGVCLRSWMAPVGWVNGVGPLRWGRWVRAGRGGASTRFYQSRRGGCATAPRVSGPTARATLAQKPARGGCVATANGFAHGATRPGPHSRRGDGTWRVAVQLTE